MATKSSIPTMTKAATGLFVKRASGNPTKHHEVLAYSKKRPASSTGK
jgi:hypothetical protein